jgi:hypothetical protein
MNPDFEDFLRALTEAGARFLVVGAHALAVHGVARATGDMDIWVEATAENASRVWQALAIFGAPTGSLGISRKDLEKPDMVIQVGLSPRRIDLLTGLSGVLFAEAWEDRVTQNFGGLRVDFLGRSSLLRNKRATGRHKDLADLEALGEPVSDSDSKR